MPFDPTLPATGTPLASQVIRNQFNGLKDLIDAIPAGPPGPEGPQGPEGPIISVIQIGSVATVDPSTPASVSVSTNGNSVELSFSIPKGETGSAGVSSTDVTNAIANEITGTARNPNTVGMLSISISNPPTQAELQAVMDKVNELIGALLR